MAHNLTKQVTTCKDLPKDFEGYFYFEGDNTLYYTFLDDEAKNGRVVQPAD